jgi:hypothetical protein
MKKTHTLNLIITDHRLKDVCLGDYYTKYPAHSDTHPPGQRFASIPGTKTHHVVVSNFKFFNAQTNKDHIKYLMEFAKTFFEQAQNLDKFVNRTVHILLGGDDFSMGQGSCSHLSKAICHLAAKIRDNMKTQVQFWCLGFGDPYPAALSQMPNNVMANWATTGYLSTNIQYDDMTHHMGPTDYWPNTKLYTPDFMMRTARRIFAHLNSYNLNTFTYEGPKTPYPLHLLHHPSRLTQATNATHTVKRLQTYPKTGKPSTILKVTLQKSGNHDKNHETPDSDQSNPTTSRSSEHSDTLADTPEKSSLTELESYQEEVLKEFEKQAREADFLPELTPEFLRSLNSSESNPETPEPSIPSPEPLPDPNLDSPLVGQSSMTVAEMQLMKTMGEAAQQARNKQVTHCIIRWNQPNILKL